MTVAGQEFPVKAARLRLTLYDGPIRITFTNTP